MVELYPTGGAGAWADVFRGSQVPGIIRSNRSPDILGDIARGRQYEAAQYNQRADREQYNREDKRQHVMKQLAEQEAQRKAAEAAAASKKKAQTGQIVGLVAGAVLAPFTFGASLAASAAAVPVVTGAAGLLNAAGASVGTMGALGGLGATIGGLFDDNPGATSGQAITQGASALQNILQEPAKRFSRENDTTRDLTMKRVGAVQQSGAGAPASYAAESDLDTRSTPMAKAASYEEAIAELAKGPNMLAPEALFPDALLTQLDLVKNPFYQGAQVA